MSANSCMVTVLMPAYNAGKYIADAIASVMSQSFRDFELLIVNDGSTDNTRDIVNSFDDSRIRLVDSAHGGVAAALNTGIREARGMYIARFDADDLCFADRLQIQAAFLDHHADYILVGSDAEYIRENGGHLFQFRCRSYAHEDILENLYMHCPFIHSAVMYRKEAVIGAGCYPEAAHNFEDYLLWVNLVKSGKCCNLPLPLIKVRFNPDSVTIDEKWRGAYFRALKMKILKRGNITAKEGQELLRILRQQDTKKIKTGSYHALCSKKFLADNYQPAKARWHAGKAIRAYPLRWDNYALFAASYLPEKWVKNLARSR
jgi:glycosyltransferase involved in cell wall biosynthesis